MNIQKLNWKKKKRIIINVIYGESLIKIGTFKLKDSIKSIKSQIENTTNIGINSEK